jgi:4-amino-4-deoxy-L-arabinose transferase-like glycosyltransferase
MPNVQMSLTDRLSVSSLRLWTELQAFLRRLHWSTFALAGILVFALVIRLILLTTVPVNVTADEADNLQFIYRVLAGHGPGWFGLDWHQSPAFSLYTMSWFVGWFGDGVWGMRLYPAILGTLTLIPFYILARERLSVFSSLLATFLLATGLWFFHFSRTGYTNINSTLFAASAAACLSLALRKDRLYYYAGVGVFAALALYGYDAGRPVGLAVAAFFPFALYFYRHNYRRVIAGFALAGMIATVLFVPQLRTILNDWDHFNTRTKAVSIFSAPTPYKGDTDRGTIFVHQVERNVKGFFLMDRSQREMSFQPDRLLPKGTIFLDFWTGLLFWTGLIAGVWRWRDTALWWCFLIVPIFVNEVFSINTPEATRSLVSTPFMYLFIGLGVETIVSILRRPTGTVWLGFGILALFIAVTSVRGSFQWMEDPFAAQGRFLALALLALLFLLRGRAFVAPAAVIALALFIAFANLQGYFNWMHEPYVAAARGPSVELAEFDQWRACQQKDAEANRSGFNVNQWEASRPACPGP